MYRQSGAFILISLVFVMAAGGAMLFAMSNLSSVSSVRQSLTHNSNMAFSASQSGLKGCLFWLNNPDLFGSNECLSSFPIAGLSPPPLPCLIEIEETCFDLTVSSSGMCKIISTAYCPGKTASDRGAKRISIDVVKRTVGAVSYYQMIPASRLVLPVGP